MVRCCVHISVTEIKSAWCVTSSQLITSVQNHSGIRCLMKHMEGKMVTLTTSWFWLFFKVLQVAFKYLHDHLKDWCKFCPEVRPEQKTQQCQLLWQPVPPATKGLLKSSFFHPKSRRVKLAYPPQFTKERFSSLPYYQIYPNFMQKIRIWNKILKFQIPKYQLLITIGTSSIPAGHKGPEPLRKAKTTCEENGLGLFEHQIAITSLYDSRTVIGLMV